MDPTADFPYCPISRQKCRAGKVSAVEHTASDGGATRRADDEGDLAYCAFWHQKENRCVFRMVEFDLFNIARCLDELRNR